MADEKKTSRLNFAFIALALLVAAAAAGAIYVRTTPSGNGGEAASADCPADAKRQAAIAQAATGAVASVRPAGPDNMSELAFQDSDGKPLTLKAFKGKTVLVNLWATWCAPCRAEMPALDRLEQQIGGDEFEVVAVNIDTGDKAKAEKFLTEIGVSALGHYRDPSMKIFNAFKSRGLALGLPATVILDPQGCLVASINGPAEWDSEDAVRLIDAVTGGN